MSAAIHVVAGTLFDRSGRVLIAQRQTGTHMAGRWEFPGGKLRSGEDRRTGLDRELAEELGIRVCDAAPLIRCRHRYPEFEVLLDIWRVRHYEGVPHGLEGQALRWIYPADLDDVDILDADRPIVTALRLPDRYAITPPQPGDLARFSQQLTRVIDSGIDLVQLRFPDTDPGLYRICAIAAVQLARGARIVLGGDPASSLPLALEIGAAGIHIPARFLSTLRPGALPSHMLVGASCHNSRELIAANDYGADFAVLGPVRATASHPGVDGLGWTAFAELVDKANLPVYALGGVGPPQLDRAIAAGAQGVAGITAFFNVEQGNGGP